MLKTTFRRGARNLVLVRRPSLCRHVAEDSVHDLAAAHLHGMQHHVEQQSPAVRTPKLPVEAIDARLDRSQPAFGKHLCGRPTIGLRRWCEGMQRYSYGLFAGI